MNHYNIGDKMDLLIVTLKTIFFYFFIVLGYRLMGKREVGELGVTDLIVSILIAEIVAISIENYNDSMLFAIVPIATLILLEIFLAWLAIKSKKVRNIFDGKPSLIISDGKINYKEMVRLRYSIDDLLLQLRAQEIKNIEEVEYAVLEANGNLSIFKYNEDRSKSSYPMPLVLDGVIQEETLNKLHKSRRWLINALVFRNLKVKDVFYAFYDKRKIYIIRKVDLINR